MGRTLRDEMIAWGEDARHIDLDLGYDQAADDVDWLSQAGENGWIVLTKDHKIQSRYPEIAAVMEYRVGLFMLPNNILSAALVSLVKHCLPRMAGIAAGRQPPFIYVVHRDGKAVRRDTEEWLQPWREERARRGLPELIR